MCRGTGMSSRSFSPPRSHPRTATRGPRFPNHRHWARLAMSVSVFFTSPERTKPMKQTIPESWLTKRRPVEQVIRHVAKTLIGHEPDWDLVIVTNSDGEAIEQSEAICDAMKDGSTYHIQEEEPLSVGEDVNDPAGAFKFFEQARQAVVTNGGEVPPPASDPVPVSFDGDVLQQDDGQEQTDEVPDETAAFVAKVEAEYQDKHGSKLHPSDPYYAHYMRKAAAKEMSSSTALAHMQEDVNDKNGGSATWGWWEQTKSEAVAYVRIPSGTKGKMLVDCRALNLRGSTRSTSPPARSSSWPSHPADECA